EAAQYCKELGIDRAMAMDGGGSTSLNYKNKIEVVSTPEKNQGRALKSFIMLYK
ncbi:phosphodiester glycosidase family protein, partial [bacterium]|nr:phosphodiester glycosidase family protein [bacterium]